MGSGFASREVSKMLGLSTGQLRGFVRSGCVEPARGPHGELRFSFRDLVLLRTAKGLTASAIPARRVKRALAQLRRKLPEGRPLSGLHVAVEGKDLVVTDGARRWRPASGQLLFDFEVRELVDQVAPLMRRAEVGGRGAEDWYAWGCELEGHSRAQAMAAYRKALELDPLHGEAHLNLGCLLLDDGKAALAAAEFREALACQPRNATASFNLGVALQDLGRGAEAIVAYEQALAVDPGLADAHYNLSRLHEQAGHRAVALRHLAAYRRLRKA
jgi:tetratricopeptide (TPR) repeat protein